MTPLEPIVYCNRDDAIETVEGLSGMFRSADLYEAYCKVAISHNRMPANKNRFGRMLTSLGAHRFNSGVNRNEWHCSTTRLHDAVRADLASQREYEAKLEEYLEGVTRPATRRYFERALKKTYKIVDPRPDVPYRAQPRPLPKKGPMAQS